MNPSEDAPPGLVIFDGHAFEMAWSLCLVFASQPASGSCRPAGAKCVALISETRSREIRFRASKEPSQLLYQSERSQLTRQQDRQANMCATTTSKPFSLCVRFVVVLVAVSNTLKICVTSVFCLLQHPETAQGTHSITRLTCSTAAACSPAARSPRSNQVTTATCCILRTCLKSSLACLALEG